MECDIETEDACLKCKSCKKQISDFISSEEVDRPLSKDELKAKYVLEKIKTRRKNSNIFNLETDKKQAIKKLAHTRITLDERNGLLKQSIKDTENIESYLIGRLMEMYPIGENRTDNILNAIKRLEMTNKADCKST